METFKTIAALTFTAAFMVGLIFLLYLAAGSSVGEDMALGRPHAAMDKAM